MDIISKKFGEPYVGDHVPGATENLPGLFVGKLYLIEDEGILYRCTDDTLNANVWQMVGTGNPLAPLDPPTANTDKNVADINEDITLTATDIDPNASGIHWDISGDYIIVTGTLDSSPITVQGQSVTTINAAVKAVGDGVTYADSAYSNIVSIDVQDLAPVYDTTLVDGEAKEGIYLTDPNGVGTFNFAKKVYDNTVPAVTMFFEVNGQLVKIDYANEYTGDSFMMEEAATGDQYCGTFAENNDSSNPTVLGLC